MMLAGIRVRDDDVCELAGLVDEPTATVLRNAVERETVIVALSIDDRERILRALDDPPDGLAELRGVLLPRARMAGARGAHLTERNAGRRTRLECVRVFALRRADPSSGGSSQRNDRPP
jgi:hypothetical protein